MRDAILVHNLGKCFKRHHSKRPHTLMETVLSGWREFKPAQTFWALRHVNFTVAPGEMLGIIGHNGAGKSTLLQLVGRVGQPSEGHVSTRGRVGALLDLGAGLHGDLTGRENIYVTAVVAGLRQRDVTRRLDEIVAFAELQPFIDNPVRTYSTGMQMRLAFAIAVHTDPDILLVDEFLSVGDLAFQSKCLERIADLKASGCAILFISHDPQQVQRLCDRALWLRQGTVIADGEPAVVVGQYKAEMQTETQRRTLLNFPQIPATEELLQINHNRFGSLEVEILDVSLSPNADLQSGDSLSIQITYQASKPVASAIFSVTISTQDGRICFDTNTALQGVSLPPIEDRGQITLQIERLDLAQGQYFVDVGVFHHHWDYAYDYHWHVYPLQVRSPTSSKGIVHPPHYWQVSRLPVPMLSRHH
jgi:lipopolysaccharide transport system ATP-binding protein